MDAKKRTTIPFCSQRTRQQMLFLCCCCCCDDGVLDRVLSHHVGGEDEDSLVFTTRPLRVIQQIGVVLAEVPKIIPCHWHTDDN